MEINCCWSAIIVLLMPYKNKTILLNLQIYLISRFIKNTDEITMIGAMPAVAVRHERRRQEKKVISVNSGDREGTSNTTGNRRPSLLTLQSPHSQADTPITSPPYIQNSLPDIYVCSKVSWLMSSWDQFIYLLMAVFC